MAAKIRLKRIGRKNRPFYRICVMDARTRRDGHPVEELGSYDPRATTFEEKVVLDKPRAHYWLNVGAQPSETVASILRKAGIRKGGPVPVEVEVEVAVAEGEADADADADASAADAPAAE